MLSRRISLVGRRQSAPLKSSESVQGLLSAGISEPSSPHVITYKNKQRRRHEEPEPSPVRQHTFSRNILEFFGEYQRISSRPWLLEIAGPRHGGPPSQEVC